MLRRGRRANLFIKAFEPLAAEVARYGAINSLSQTVLKLTVPGVPDIYQGNEIWDFSLVDPDNRRPVDYALRRRMLDSLKGVEATELLDRWQDGRIKLFVTRAVLQYRSEQPELFRNGNYKPLEVTGRFADNVVAFQREHNGTAVLVVVPRLASKVGFPPVGDKWLDTAITLPKVAPLRVLGGSCSLDSRLKSVKTEPVCPSRKCWQLSRVRVLVR